MQTNKVFLVGTVVSIVVLIVFGFLLWGGVPLSLPPTSIATLLSPLLLTAAFIERAVEVLVSPLRDSGAFLLRQRLLVEQAVTPPDSVAIAKAQQVLADYQQDTKQYAFTAAFLLGLCAAFIGIRSLGVFVPNPLPATVSLAHGQLAAFKVFDVFLTAALLAGGADGLHAPINAFTSFFNNSAANSQTSQAS